MNLHKSTFFKAHFLLVGVSLALCGIARAQTPAFQYNLYYGVNDWSDVTALQEFLTEQGDYSGPISGHFYALTAKAVKQFQSEHDLPVSGYFGALSRGVANALLAADTPVPPPSELATSTQPIASSTQTVAPVVPPITASTDFSLFAPTSFSNYAGDPPAYLGTMIKVKGTVNGQFLAAGDKGGDTNYVGVADPNARVADTVLLKIPRNTDYQKAVAALQPYDLVAAYGYGVASIPLTASGATTLAPVIALVRLDLIGACGLSGCGEGAVKTIFP